MRLHKTLLWFTVSLGLVLIVLVYIVPAAAGKTLEQPVETPTSAEPMATTPPSIVIAVETPAVTITTTVTPVITGTVDTALTATPFASPTPLPAAPITATITLSATETVTVTETPTTTITPQPSSEATQPPFNYLPLISRSTPPTPTQFPTGTLMLCSNPSVPIPDDIASGVTDTIVIDDARYIQDINVYLDIRHPWVGDLSAHLSHADTGNNIDLMQRPGHPDSPLGCDNKNVGAILDDEITFPVEKACGSSSYSPAGIAGIYTPDNPLSTYDGESIAGSWTLKIADHSKNDTGILKSWCLVATVGEKPDPTPTPPPPKLPSQARIYNISGKPQSLPLDCESRVAVDWAAYFGVHIGELQFFNHLPVSDNPDVGFVGDVYGRWGQIPPNPYGVHAEPVAALLRSYGVEAYAHRPLSWDDLRAEIAAGRPVYVWTIGSGAYNEVPIYYTAQDGQTTIVAHYEHTIMVIGYNDNNGTVTILDGGTIYTRSRKLFLTSWSALDNMAITARP